MIRMDSLKSITQKSNKSKNVQSFEESLDKIEEDLDENDENIGNSLGVSEIKNNKNSSLNLTKSETKRMLL